MLAILGLVIIITIGWLGSIYIFSKEKLPTSLRYLFFSGWEFILIGIAMGPYALDLFPLEIILQLDPLVHLGLGWVGLFIGLQLKWKDLNRLHPEHFLVTTLQSVFTGLLVAMVSWPILEHFFQINENTLPIAVTILAASAALSSPTVVFLLSRETGFKDEVIRLLQMITNLDGVISILAVGIGFTLLRPEAAGIKVLILISQPLIVGCALGYLFYLIPHKKLSENETLVVIIGFLLFSSGAGGMLQVSPLFLNMIIGIFLANSLPKNDPFYAAIINLEKPMYVVLLIISGLLFTVPGKGALLLAFAIITVRLGAKFFFISNIAPRIDPHLKFPPKTGLALASQGAMALVVGLAFLSSNPGTLAKNIFSVIVVCVMANEIIAPYLVSHVFKKAKQ